jgi:hypothetical protein
VDLVAFKFLGEKVRSEHVSYGVPITWELQTQSAILNNRGQRCHLYKLLIFSLEWTFNLFTPEERVLDTHWIRGCEGARATEDMVTKRGPCPCWVQNPGSHMLHITILILRFTSLLHCVASGSKTELVIVPWCFKKYLTEI